MTRAHLLVDGENIEITLRREILRQRRLERDDRPDWEVVYRYVERRFDARNSLAASYFLNVTQHRPDGFIDFLRRRDYRPVLLKGHGKQIVDQGIGKVLTALRTRPGDVILVSNDGDYEEYLSSIRSIDAKRRIAVIGFSLYVSGKLRGIPGVEIIDLDTDVGAFRHPLPIKPIHEAGDVAEFDAEALLDLIDADARPRSRPTAQAAWETAWPSPGSWDVVERLKSVDRWIEWRQRNGSTREQALRQLELEHLIEEVGCAKGLGTGEMIDWLDSEEKRTGQDWRAILLSSRPDRSSLRPKDLLSIVLDDFRRTLAEHPDARDLAELHGLRMHIDDAYQWHEHERRSPDDVIRGLITEIGGLTSRLRNLP